MKKTIFPVLLIFILGISACSGSQVNTTRMSNDLSLAAKLAIGTLKLDGTEQAVTSEQANELLFLWQVYQELNSSDTAAQAEIDGLVEQIQKSMTPAQMSAIKAMNLTQQDVFALLQEQGGNFTQGGQSSSGSSNSTQSGGFTPSGGGMAGGPPDGGGLPGGAPPDGGLGGIGGVGPSSSSSQTQSMVAGSGTRSVAGVPTPLVSALIQYLEQVASA